MAATLRMNVFLAAKGKICPSYVTVQLCQNSQTARIIRDPNETSFSKGLGARNSFNGLVCTVFGAAGTIGKPFVQLLARTGTQIIVATSSDYYKTRQLKVCGDLGQILFTHYHMTDEEAIRKAVKYSDVVVNLANRFVESYRFRHHRIHIDLPRTIARICKESNVKHFIHFSAIGARPDPEPILLPEGSEFLRTKYYGELAVREEFPDATIVRPSCVIAPKCLLLRHHLDNRRLSTRRKLILPMINYGLDAEKEPVLVTDVAEGLKRLVFDYNSAGKTYQFVGPERYTLNGFLGWIHEFMYYKQKNIDEYFKYPTWHYGNAFWRFFKPKHNPDHLDKSLIEFFHNPDIIYKELPTLEDLGIVPTNIRHTVWFIVKDMLTDTWNYYARPDEELFPLRGIGKRYHSLSESKAIHA
ncbi:NADH dehydrogenase [ubiquinone] 1 alpha subcomplex subunit 9, mitochondrial [Prorops nasuta]|uniref:NADH dehydrogenase [ubiquinone] 1 alpha subcomplex subunit 9, mitochondrial n=1 Tax=Prorops nasuta TaxID=863751 RepID=UPI0034CF8133